MADHKEPENKKSEDSIQNEDLVEPKKETP